MVTKKSPIQSTSDQRRNAGSKSRGRNKISKSVIPDKKKKLEIDERISSTDYAEIIRENRAIKARISAWTSK